MKQEKSETYNCSVKIPVKLVLDEKGFWIYNENPKKQLDEILDRITNAESVAKELDKLFAKGVLVVEE